MKIAIIGTRGIPNNYGGFEQFAEHLSVLLAEKGNDIPNKWNIECADIKTYQTNKQYDFIITDPPYPKEYLPLYETLAIRSKEWLKDNGLLIMMCGQSYIDEIYKMLDNQLIYYWTACYLTPGQPTPLRQRQVNTTWKPILIYSKNKDYLKDHFRHLSRGIKQFGYGHVFYFYQIFLRYLSPYRYFYFRTKFP